VKNGLELYCSLWVFEDVLSGLSHYMLILLQASSDMFLCSLASFLLGKSEEGLLRHSLVCLSLASIWLKICEQGFGILLSSYEVQQQEINLLSS